MAARITAILPSELFDPQREDEVILLIAQLPIDPEDRKALIWEWTQMVGVALTEEMVDRVRGHP